ncbi:MAG: hypothetical protein ACKOE6_15120 [Flammeovirgaceae bacterium]
MKTIKSSLIGVKQITASGEQQILLELRDILAKHRDVVVNHLLKDAHTYVLYKTAIKPSPQVITDIKDRLVSLKKSPLDLAKYEPVCKAVLNRALVHLDNAHFYAEIDEIIRAHVGKPVEHGEQVKETEEVKG